MADLWPERATWYQAGAEVLDVENTRWRVQLRMSQLEPARTCGYALCRTGARCPDVPRWHHARAY